MADKKPQKLKARLPRGLADRGPAEIAATRAMIEKIRAVYERYGFEPVETPAIEYTDALGKFLPDQDRPNEGVFSFQDDDEQWLSLRYDLTAPLARYVAENFQNLALPYRSYREGWVFRNEKPGPGRYRQFMQFDADTVGSASPAADAEMCMMAADAMEALGIRRGDYIVKVNSRKALDELLEDILTDPNQQLTADPDQQLTVDPKQQLTVLRAIDKLDRLGKEGVAQLLGAGRKDESGDFTKGAGLPEDAIKAVLDFLSKGLLSDDLIEIRLMVEKLGYSDRVKIDPSVVRGLEYYTGAVFEVELTFETKDEKGRPVRFGSVGGGGRYDGLVSRFRGQPVPATGFSIGVSRLLAALQAIKSPIVAASAPSGPVLVVAFDRDRLAHYQGIVQTLRNAGIRAEMYLGNPRGGLGPQLKYADRRRAPCAIIQGPDEKERGIVQIKDLAIGAQLADDTTDRDAYLAKQAQAQFAVQEDKLVDAVKKLLDGHGLKY